MHPDDSSVAAIIFKKLLCFTTNTTIVLGERICIFVYLNADLRHMRYWLEEFVIWTENGFAEQNHLDP